MTILHGTEVDILGDGTLDFPDAVLERPRHRPRLAARVAWPAARTSCCERYVRAMEHPLVNVITHPANRVPGRSEGYALDWGAFFAAAARTGTAVEVDGAPGHLDLDGHLARRAVEAGATLSVDSDGHFADRLGRQMRMGVGTARRGGVAGAAGAQHPAARRQSRPSSPPSGGWRCNGRWHTMPGRCSAVDPRLARERRRVWPCLPPLASRSLLAVPWRRGVRPAGCLPPRRRPPAAADDVAARLQSPLRRRQRLLRGLHPHLRRRRAAQEDHRARHRADQEARQDALGLHLARGEAVRRGRRKIYAWVPADRQVTVSAHAGGRRAGDADPLPRRPRQPHPRLHVVMRGAVPGAPAGHYALQLVPKRKVPDYERADAGRRSRVVRRCACWSRATARAGTSTFTFTNLKENVGIPDSKFAFTIPRGAEVVTGADARPRAARRRGVPRWSSLRRCWSRRAPAPARMRAGRTAERAEDYDRAVVEYTRALRASSPTTSVRSSRCSAQAARLAGSLRRGPAARRHGQARGGAGRVPDRGRAEPRQRRRRRAAARDAHAAAREDRGPRRRQDAARDADRQRRDLAPPGFDLPRGVTLADSLVFRNAGVRDILTAIGHFAGINVVFDPQFRDQTLTDRPAQLDARGRAAGGHLEHPQLLSGHGGEDDHGDSRHAGQAPRVRGRDHPHVLS